MKTNNLLRNSNLIIVTVRKSNRLPDFAYLLITQKPPQRMLMYQKEKNNNKLPAQSEQQCFRLTYMEKRLFTVVMNNARRKERDRAQWRGERFIGEERKRTLKPTKAQLVIYTGKSENEMVIFSSSKTRRREFSRSRRKIFLCREKSQQKPNRQTNRRTNEWTNEGWKMCSAEWEKEEDSSDLSFIRIISIVLSKQANFSFRKW